MKKNELPDDKFIFPRGVWECWICEHPKINLSPVELEDDMVLLVCRTCARHLVRALNEEEELLIPLER